MTKECCDKCFDEGVSQLSYGGCSDSECACHTPMLTNQTEKKCYICQPGKYEFKPGEIVPICREHHNPQKENKWEEKFNKKLTEWIDSGEIDEGVWIQNEIKNFLTQAISEERESLTKKIKAELLKRMMKYDSKDGYSTMHDEILEKVSNDVEDILSIINKQE